MSRETLEWLNENVLVGYTGKRGNAWHYLASAQGAEPNHYDGPVPVADVQRRLFGWSALEASVHFDNEVTLDQALVPDRKVYYRSDTGTVLGLHSTGHAGHDYGKWLVENASALLDTSDLAIGQAGLLRGGAVAWVSIEMEDTIDTPQGVEFRPQMLLTTSFDGSLATTYMMVNTIVVCDNTLSAGLREGGAKFKTKHTRNSSLRIADAREALQFMHNTADAFSAELAGLCETHVSERQWWAFLDAHVPVPQEKGRARTIAENKRGELGQLWNHDVRVTPWRNTAFGVLQADNTWRTHLGTVKNVQRAERNRLRVLEGESQAADRQALATLTGVLASV